MDRARRAEPYSSATLWTREVARNLAGHLARVSNAHSCVDTGSPKATHLPKFHHSKVLKDAKRCTTSPVKARKAIVEPTSDTIDSVSTERREESHDDDNQISDVPAKHHLEKPHRGNLSLKNLSKSELQPESDRLLEHTKTASTDHALEKVRVPVHARTKSPSGTADSTYDCPPALASTKTTGPVDYNKKQAQLKIWRENQALAKRLRSTKATLRSKEWEKDDKWNQEFLKSQERRRSLLQTELVKAQLPPHTTLVRVRPVKLPHQEPRNVSQDDDVESAPIEFTRCRTSGGHDAISGSLSAREIRRRRSRSKTLSVEPLGENEAQNFHSSAANHRRIMQLRQQKSQANAKESATIDLNDDEMVDVRFTFLRRKCRRGSDSNNPPDTEVQTNTNAELETIEANQTSVKNGVQRKILASESACENDLVMLSGQPTPPIGLSDGEPHGGMVNSRIEAVSPDAIENESTSRSCPEENEKEEQACTQPCLLDGPQSLHERSPSDRADYPEREPNEALTDDTLGIDQMPKLSVLQHLAESCTKDLATKLAENAHSEKNGNAELVEGLNNDPSLAFPGAFGEKSTCDINSSSEIDSKAIGEEIRENSDLPEIDSNANWEAIRTDLEHNGENETKDEAKPEYRDGTFDVQAKDGSAFASVESHTTTDACVIAFTCLQQAEEEPESSHHDNHEEASGYGSEFDDDDVKDYDEPELLDNKADERIENTSHAQTAADELEYSEDDFTDE